MEVFSGRRLISQDNSSSRTASPTSLTMLRTSDLEVLQHTPSQVSCGPEKHGGIFGSEAHITGQFVVAYGKSYKSHDVTDIRSESVTAYTESGELWPRKAWRYFRVGGSYHRTIRRRVRQVLQVSRCYGHRSRYAWRTPHHTSTASQRLGKLRSLRLRPHEVRYSQFGKRK